MKKSFFLLVILFFTSISFADELWCYISQVIKKGKLNVVVTPDYWYISAEIKAYFQELLHSYLIEDGNHVIERKRLEEVISELKMDQSGIVKQGNINSNLTDRTAKTDLKKIGELLGADVILFFSSWITVDDKNRIETQHIGFRLVDCQTGVILLSGHIKQKDPVHAARLIVGAINAARNNCRVVIGHHFVAKPYGKMYKLIKEIGDDWYAYECK